MLIKKLALKKMRRNQISTFQLFNFSTFQLFQKKRFFRNAFFGKVNIIENLSFLQPGDDPTKLCFPIFAVRLECLYRGEDYVITMKWPSLSAKNRKIERLRRKKVWQDRLQDQIKTVVLKLVFQTSGSQPGVRKKCLGVRQIFINLRLTL